MYSNSPLSCVANPVCTNVNASVPHSVYNNRDIFVPIESFNGDPSDHLFLFESGYLGQGGQGVQFETNKGHASRVSTARYMLYGTVEATLRHDTQKGLISTFGTLSDVGDAIMWQFTGQNKSTAAANYYAMNNQTDLTGTTLHLGSNFSAAEFHTYGLVWNEQGIRWTLDGREVHRVTRSQAGAQFPRSPSRVLFTTWGATPQTPRRLKKWAGGSMSYKSSMYTTQGYFSQELSHLRIECANLKQSNVTVTGAGSSPQAYVYTGKNSSVSGEPEFFLSRDKIQLISNPAKDGPDDVPGSPNLLEDGPNTNMFAGGTRNINNGASASSGDGQSKNGTNTSNSRQGDAHSESTSTKVAIGVPVGIGGAVLLGALALLAAYLLRRQRKKKAAPPPPPPPMHEQPSAPPLGIHSPSPHPAMYAPPPNAAYPQAYAPPAAMQGSPGVPSAPSTMPYSQPEVPPSHSDATMIPMPAQDDKTLQEENTISTGYPGASYDETLTSDLDSERTASSDASLPSSPAPRRRHRMHYSMPGGRHGGSYASRLTKDQLEELAAQDEWHDLHHAALGADNEVFFQARSPASTLPSSGGRARAHYSRRGAHGSSASASGRPAGSDYRSHARRRSHYASDL